MPRVGLFATCLMNLFRPTVGFAAARLLEDAGCTVEVPLAQSCCGQPGYNSGDFDAARALAKHREELVRGRRFHFLHRLPDLSGSQAALGYVLANPDVSAAIFGATRPAHLRENLRASGRSLPAEVMAKVRAAQT